MNWSLIFFTATLTTALHAAVPAPTFEAQLILADGAAQTVHLLTATQVSVRYRETKTAAEIQDRKRTDFASVRVLESPDFRVAVDLFQSRRYHEALKSFAALKSFYEPISTLPDNPGTLSAFYELECLRKLGDLEGLSKGLETFNKDPLIRENHLRQIEINLIWDAVRTKNWPQVESLVKDREKQRLPDSQRAQISYCHALALDALGKSAAALDAYNTALTADLGASEEISRKSALAILKILSADPAVKSALKTPGSTTSAPVKEAQAIAKLFQLSLGAGEPLPAEYQIFLDE